MKFFWNKYLVFLLSFFQPMIINIGGEVSPSFLFILFSSPFWIQELKFKHDRILQYFAILFGLLLAVQFVWIPFAHTTLFIQIKGIMVTVSGLTYFVYFYLVMRKNPKVVKWIVLGEFLASFVFMNVLVEREGSEFGFWKFQLMPRLVISVILVFLWFVKFYWIQKIAPFLLIGIGILGLATGARSTGLVALITGMLTLSLQQKEYFQIKNVKTYLIISIVLLYIAYAFIYVPNVLNGTIQAGNTEQLKRTDNPYNPLNLLKLGRTDAIIPFVAFADKPITGWGYFTRDPNFKYRKLQIKEMSSIEEMASMHIEIGRHYNIPGHSVWGYYSCSYGIIAFVTIFLIIIRTWQYAYRSFNQQNCWLLYRNFLLVDFTWNVIFSPMAHFKTLPMSIAIILVLSTLRNRQIWSRKEKLYNDSANVIR